MTRPKVIVSVLDSGVRLISLQHCGKAMALHETKPQLVNDDDFRCIVTCQVCGIRQHAFWSLSRQYWHE